MPARQSEVFRRPVKLNPQERRIKDLWFKRNFQKNLKATLLTEYFNLTEKEVAHLTEREIQVYYLIRSYDISYKYLVLPQQVRKFYKGICRSVDPKKFKLRIWKVFSNLLDLLEQYNIVPRTYFYYWFYASRKKCHQWWLLANEGRIATFLQWYYKKKANGDDPDRAAVFKHTEVENKQTIWEDKLKREMYKAGVKTEREYWLSILPEEVAEYPVWFLRQREAYIDLFLEGELVAPLYPDPFKKKRSKQPSLV
ncbi:MAG: hypothetical protein DRI61_10975 [Chloroflexi bacterium]|nr:MAG: hypothetical protein DRI61_10975 [Chloroflexota bacterium]